mgnify:FL=1
MRGGGKGEGGTLGVGWTGGAGSGRAQESPLVLNECVGTRLAGAGRLKPSTERGLHDFRITAVLGPKCQSLSN